MNEGIHRFVPTLVYSDINTAFVKEVNVKIYFQVLVTEELFVHCWLCYTSLTFTTLASYRL